MDKLYLGIAILVLLYYLYTNGTFDCLFPNKTTNKTDMVANKEHFDVYPTSVNNNELVNLAEEKCDNLDKQLDYPRQLMAENSNVPLNMKEREAINSKLTYRENATREIFTNIDKNSWCATKNNTESSDIGVYNAQPDNMMSEADHNTYNVDKYNIINGQGFNPNTTDHMYATVQ